MLPSLFHPTVTCRYNLLPIIEDSDLYSILKLPLVYEDLLEITLESLST